MVKCENRDCCRPLRSALHTVVRGRFMPPPYPILQVTGEPTVPEPGEHNGKSFAPFLLRQSLTVYPKHAGYSQMPYDYYCPSLLMNDQTIHNRCCKTCGIYFASCVKLQKHRSALHATPRAPVVRVRPTRVVTRRAEELLCAVDDRLEWLHEEDVHTSNDCLPVLPKHMDVMCPIITIEEAHECPWSE